MSPLRQALYGIALLGALTLLLWGQDQRIKVADGATELAQLNAANAQEDSARNLTTANALQSALQQERAAQALLRTQQTQLRQGLAQRKQQIEALKSENSELRDWAAQPLPDAALRLRQRPTLTGADAYRQWLSSGSTVPASGDQPQR
ncbi:Phage endolysin [Pseudomonas batumici]|uniref:Phage endolysin n=1 Tax=Pseudomonas batumici TaxID=226910 RepID=A0A0C2I4S9_9PSED|nr:Rz-like lysis system protein LysB [Pseudomonas batumici]KIH84216.1 Phage endolysin [Pseudomonas batumici]